MPRLIVTNTAGTVHELAVRDGESVMRVTRAACLPALGECNGSMAYTTYHVIVDPDWALRLPPPSTDEVATW